MKSKKSAFTLIEILIVVGIIIMLLGMATKMLGTTKEAQGKKTAIAQMAVIASAIEEFRSVYGDYPRLSCASSEKQNAAKLYQCLTGKMYMTKEGSTIVFKSLSDTATRKPLLDAAKMNLGNTRGDEESDVNPESSNTFLVDPWGNPYIYIYNTSTSLGVSGSWKSPSFILLSKGEDGESSNVGSVYTTGNITDVESYKARGDNKDNIIYGID